MYSKIVEHSVKELVKLYQQIFLQPYLEFLPLRVHSIIFR